MSVRPLQTGVIIGVTTQELFSRTNIEAVTWLFLGYTQPTTARRVFAATVISQLPLSMARGTLKYGAGYGASGNCAV